MDINLIIESLKYSISFITISYLGKNTFSLLKNKISLQKVSKYESEIIKDSKINFKRSNINIKNINKKLEKEKSLIPLITKLGNYTSNDNLKIACINLTSATITKKPKIFLLGSKGTYDTEKNIIKLSSDSISDFGHEFLHLSSSYYDEEEDIGYSGFCQSKGNIEIGRGLNEGYTELLASRIYNKENKVEAYQKEVQIAKIFELFFDNPKDMENYYFNHNLTGFIRYMEKFAKRDEVIKLIADIDNINSLTDLILSPYTTYKYIKINLTLYKWFEKNNKNNEKLEECQKILNENKLLSLVMNNKKIKLHKYSPYDNHNRHKPRKL